MKHALHRTASRITYRFQSSDVQIFYFNDIVRRTRSAVQRAGGELCGGVRNLPQKIKKWTVLRSPHVNKKSREKFWMVDRLRVFEWDAPLGSVDREAPRRISEHMPSSVAVRVVEDVPGLAEVLCVYNTLERVREGPKVVDDGKVDKVDDKGEGESEAESGGEEDDKKNIT